MIYVYVDYVWQKVVGGSPTTSSAYYFFNFKIYLKAGQRVSLKFDTSGTLANNSKTTVMKKYMMIMLATMMVSSGFAKDDYKAKMDAFVSNLLGKMTVDEKIGQ
jgi:hypothetical protein